MNKTYTINENLCMTIEGHFEAGEPVGNRIGALASYIALDGDTEIPGILELAVDDDFYPTDVTPDDVTAALKLASRHPLSIVDYSLSEY